ncbi:MAG: zinc-ribbon domain-containing protein [Oscillospiraceae bacterium]|nr:zinc-ribbon domain-containing protein [Oscillospiraceae bacterium]
MAFCVRCGKRIPEGIVFCPYCGTNLKELMAGFEQPASQPAPQDFMEQRPTVEAQPVYEQPVTEAQPVYEQPVTEAQPVYEQPVTEAEPAAAQIPVAGDVIPPVQPPVENPPPVQEQPPVQQNPHYTQPPYGTQQSYSNPRQPYGNPGGYRSPFYTQMEDLGYLHVKKQDVPARGLGILGRILGILGMISSIIMMTAMLFLCTNYMGIGVGAFLRAFEDKGILLFLGVFESIILSILGVALSRSAAKKGNPSTAAGKRLGIVGLVLSAVNLVDLILALIVLVLR